MNYLISEAGSSLEISQELWNLSVLGQREGQIFEVITHPSNGFTALVVGNLDTEILVHPNKNTDRLKELLTDPPYDQATKDQLEAYIDSVVIPQEPPEPPSGYVLGRFPFRNVVEGYVPIHDEQYMIDNGWEI